MSTAKRCIKSGDVISRLHQRKDSNIIMSNRYQKTFSFALQKINLAEELEERLEQKKKIQVHNHNQEYLRKHQSLEIDTNKPKTKNRID